MIITHTFTSRHRAERWEETQEFTPRGFSLTWQAAIFSLINFKREKKAFIYAIPASLSILIYYRWRNPSVRSEQTTGNHGDLDVFGDYWYEADCKLNTSKGGATANTTQNTLNIKLNTTRSQPAEKKLVQTVSENVPHDHTLSSWQQGIPKQQQQQQRTYSCT